jgi:hypothetical protein
MGLYKDRCEECGERTDNISRIVLPSGDHVCHTCDKCIEQERKVEWQNEKWKESTTICPWCEHEFDSEENTYDEGESSVICPMCGKKFECEAELIWEFTTRKPLELMDMEEKP